MIALDGDDRGTGSGRSIPGFDLLAGLDACAAHLLRHGGHRAAAGCTVAASEVDALRAAFVAHAAAVLDPADLVPAQRIDAIVSAEDTGIALAEELGAARPVRDGQPAPGPAHAGGADDRRADDGGGQARALHRERGRRARERGGVRPRAAARRPRGRPRRGLQPRDQPLERRGGAAARPARRRAARARADLAAPAASRAGRRSPRPSPSSTRRSAIPAATAAPPRGRRRPSRRRDRGDAHGARRRRASRCSSSRRAANAASAGWRAASAGSPSAPGTSWSASPVWPMMLSMWSPSIRRCWRRTNARCGGSAPAARRCLAWGDPELRFTQDVLEHDAVTRPALMAAVHGPARRRRRAAARTSCSRPTQHRTAAYAGRLLRVLVELGLVEVDRATGAWRLPTAERTDLDRSPAFRAEAVRLQEGRAWLSRASSRAA